MLDENQLKETTDRMVADIIDAKLAVKIFYKDERLGQDYWNLCTPDAFNRKFIAITVLGHPEQAGVWSYTLLQQSRINDTSMEPYFREFGKQDFGLVAINPHMLQEDLEGDSFVYQLERVIADIPPDRKIGLMGFSMGGRIVMEFLERRPRLLKRIAGLVLIDPIFSHSPKIYQIRELLDKNTLLIASEGKGMSPGKTASTLLKTPSISLQGIHGEMPNKALGEIISFYKKRLP